MRQDINNHFQPCFLSFRSTISWFKRSFSLLNSLSFLLVSWLYWLARLAIMLCSLCTWQGKPQYIFYFQDYQAARKRATSLKKKITSSFSFFRAFCRLFTCCRRPRSLSRSPVFSLFDTSSWSCVYRMKTFTWPIYTQAVITTINHAADLQLSSNELQGFHVTAWPVILHLQVFQAPQALVVELN